MKKLHTLFPVTIMVLLCLCTDVSGSESIETATTGLESKLEQGFLKPSEAAKPWVYWYMT